MGKRSRKRSAAGDGVRPRPAGPPSADATRRRAQPVDRRSRTSQAPPAPWSPFPLVELVILAGLVCIVVGFVAGGDRRGPLLVAGFALVSLAALELTVREHLAGFRSHTTLLSAIIGLLPVVPLYIATSVPQVVLLIVGVVVFLVAAGALRALFARRAGGLAFRA